MSHAFNLHTGRRRSALVLLLLAACLPFAARAVAGSPGALVHVRWQASLDAAARQALETRFRLDAPERLDDVTWRYDLIDTSGTNIRALVAHPAVADTHEIDRPNFTIASSASRTGHRQRFAFGSGLVAAADIIAVSLAALVALMGLAALVRTAPALQAGHRRLSGLARQIAAQVWQLTRGIARPLGRIVAPAIRFVQRAVPEIDSRAAGVFRVVFGVTILSYFAFPTHHVDVSWLSITFDSEVQGPVHAWAMEWLGAHPYVVNLITPWLIVTGIAFVVGAWTTMTYALFVAGVLAWAYVAMSVDSTHPHSTLVLTLVALLPSRWGDAVSIDAWWRRRTGREPLGIVPARRYGYTVWIPVLTFGVGFAAAAWAKLTVPPEWTSWILNGTVKYHIISDSAGAPVPWGAQLVRHPLLAVLLSFGAIAIEALVVTAAFVRSERYRLAMGLSAASLFAGIGLFMGIAWPGWWIPLLAFLPWSQWARRAPATRGPGTVAAAPLPGARHGLTPVQLLMVALVIGQQVTASALRLERAPMFSWYDMYARSYTSPDDYNASIPPVYQIVITSDRARVPLRCSPHEELVRDFEAALAGNADSRERVMRALRGCGADLSSARQVTFEGNARTFDWDRLRFTVTCPVSLGPLLANQDDTAALKR